MHLGKLLFVDRVRIIPVVSRIPLAFSIDETGACGHAGLADQLAYLAICWVTHRDFKGEIINVRKPLNVF